MTISLQFTEQDWERIENDWTSWWAGELTRPLVIIENPVRSRDPEELTRAFLLEKPIDQVLDYYQARLESKRFYGDAWPKWWPFYGAGIVAGFLGTPLGFAPKTDTIWFEPDEALDIEHAQLTYDADNIWWRRIRELTHAAVERWGNQVCVGFTDLGGNLDILASMRTTQTLLFDLYDYAEDVIRLSNQINRLWLRYYNELFDIIQHTGRGTTPWAPIWAPGRCYMLQSDFSYMLSPEMFEQFVLPDISTCCDAFDYAFYHLDGKGQIPHLDMLLSLDNLHGIQWIPGGGQPPPEGWLPLLKRIRDGGKLCQLFVSCQGARTIIRELGGQGFAFYIMDPLAQEDAADFLQTLAAEDANS